MQNNLKFFGSIKDILIEFPVLKIISLLQLQQSSLVELVNGGFGIKNPSYRAPKPSDITNIQQGKKATGCVNVNKP